MTPKVTGLGEERCPHGHPARQALAPPPHPGNPSGGRSVGGTAQLLLPHRPGGRSGFSRWTWVCAPGASQKQESGRLASARHQGRQQKGTRGSDESHTGFGV